MTQAQIDSFLIIILPEIKSASGNIIYPTIPKHGQPMLWNTFLVFLLGNRSFASLCSYPPVCSMIISLSNSAKTGQILRISFPFGELSIMPTFNTRMTTPSPTRISIRSIPYMALLAMWSNPVILLHYCIIRDFKKTFIFTHPIKAFFIDYTYPLIYPFLMFSQMYVL